MTITIVVEGIEVQGEITHRSAGDISVRITKPYRNLSSGLHIPYFGRAHRSFDGDYGDEVSKSLLKDIYRIGRHLDQNLDSLRSRLDHAKHAIRRLPLPYNKNEVDGKRKELKALLRAGKLRNTEYQKELISLRKRVEHANHEIETVMKAFFENCFPMGVPYGPRNEVLEILEGKKDLIGPGIP